MNPSLYKVELYRSALLVVFLALLVIITGAFITSTEVAARQPQSAIAPEVGGGLHRALAVVLVACILGIAIWISATPTARWLRAVAWSGVVTLAVGAALEWQTPPLSPKIAVFHALSAHFFLSLSTVIAVGTSAGWNREPERVDGSSPLLLRPLAVATPPIVFLQITLGAAYRHDMTSIMPHMAIAMGVAFLALIGSTVVLQNFPGPPPLRRAAVALISIVLLQVCLGIGAFLMLVLNAAGTFYFVATSVGHVLVGASTLAASVIMAMQVWRSVLPKQPNDG
jgi:heme A synthase